MAGRQQGDEQGGHRDPASAGESAPERRSSHQRQQPRPLVYATRAIPRAILAAGPAEGIDAHAALDVGLDRERLAVAEGLLCFAGDPVGEPLLSQAPRLRAIATASAGFDHLDLAAARRRRIALTHTPGVLTEATAELAFALILAASRHVVEGDRLLRRGGFRGFAFDLLLGRELAGSTLGVVGAGRIGSAVLARGAAFEMRPLYWSRHPSPAAEALGARRADSLDALLAASDVVSLHVPLAPETHHLIGARELARLRPTAVLVNTSRGPVVDEAALAAALRAGRLFAAGLDVYEREPEVEPALLDLPNVVLLPHLGSATERTRGRMLATALADLRRVLAGEPPAHAIPDPSR